MTTKNRLTLVEALIMLVCMVGLCFLTFILSTSYTDHKMNEHNAEWSTNNVDQIILQRDNFPVPPQPQATSWFQSKP
jgi:hypothetical protein